MPDRWRPDDAIAALRRSVPDIDDDAQRLALDALADYLDETTLPVDVAQSRNVWAEIALAYVAGYQNGALERPRELLRAVKAAGLSV